MAKPNFGQVFLGGVQSLLQHNTERGLRESPGGLITQGKLMEGIAVSTTTTPFPHGLGRRPRGWFPVDRDADVRVWRVSWDDKFLTLDASGNATINIWVF